MLYFSVLLVVLICDYIMSTILRDCSLNFNTTNYTLSKITFFTCCTFLSVHPDVLTESFFTSFFRGFKRGCIFGIFVGFLPVSDTLS